MLGRDILEKNVWVTIHPEHCARYQHKSSKCTACIELCSSGAITLFQNHPYYDATLCLKCGACYSSCPLDAIEIHQTQSDKELLQEIVLKADLGEKITFTCKQVDVKNKGVIFTGCLAKLDPSILLFALEKGVSAITLNAGICDECLSPNILPRIHKMVEQTVQCLDLFGIVASLSVESLKNSSTKLFGENTYLSRNGHSRRRFFLKFINKKNNEPSVEDTTMIHLETTKNSTKMYTPEKHRRFIHALQALSKKVPSIGEASSLCLSPHIDATQCSGCTICANVCPTGALQVHTNEETLKITCTGSSCVGCNLCVDVCFKKAMTLSPCNTMNVTLYERQKNEIVFSPAEKMSELLGATIYKT